MNIDNIDVNLFLYFLEEKTKSFFTVVDVAKHLFQPKTRRSLIKKVSMLNYRLKKWVDAEVFKLCVNDGVKCYELNMDHIHYGDSSLIIGEDKVVETGKAIALQIKGETYLTVCFLQEEDEV